MICPKLFLQCVFPDVGEYSYTYAKKLYKVFGVFSESSVRSDTHTKQWCHLVQHCLGPRTTSSKKETNQWVWSLTTIAYRLCSFSSSLLHAMSSGLKQPWQGQHITPPIQFFVIKVIVGNVGPKFFQRATCGINKCRCVLAATSS